MSNGLNKVMLIGNVGTDPDLRTTQSGKTVVNFRLAVTERYQRDGESMESTTWHNIVAWGGLAETIGKYCSKGRSLYVEGRMQSRKWEDSGGNKRYTTEVVAQRVQFLGGRAEEKEQEDSRQEPSNDIDMPF